MDDYLIASKQARVEYIDLFRAFGILLMIIGHIRFCPDESSFDKWIHAFHMPMFFIVSGLFYRKQEITELLKKRFRTLIVPYLIVGVLFSLIPIVIRGNYSSLVAVIFENTSGYIFVVGAIWFLTSLFFADIGYHLIDIIEGNKKHLAVVLIALGGMIMAEFSPIRLPYGLDSAMIGVGFIHVGRCISEKYKNATSLSLGLSVSLFLTFSFLAIVNGYVNMRKGTYGIWPLFWINAIGLSVSSMNIIRILDRRISHLRDRKLIECFYLMGKDSIVFLVFNQAAIFGTRLIISRLYNIDTKTVLMINAIVFLLSLIELFIIRSIIMKTRLRVIFGKN